MSRCRLVAMACLVVLGVTRGSVAIGAELPLAGAVIVVDPGHGGQRDSMSYTGGTRGVGSRQTESELNLRVSFELTKLLRQDGATVFMTREADHRLSPEGSTNSDELHARIDFFEHHNCHFFLAVHHNAGRATATGHTALYKNNAMDDTLYEAIARDVNDALEGAVPGPKNKLIRGNYHILRETSIPGTISEAGYMTNKAFDDLCVTPKFPKVEAAAIHKGAVKYWKEHRDALIALRQTLSDERATTPRDPATVTAIAFNTEFRNRMTQLLSQVAPDGKYVAAKAPEHVQKFREVAVTEPDAVFNVTVEVKGNVITLKGETSDAKLHNQLIDLFVAMKLFKINN
ncbi:MAG TPA: N-acetylmuramoyl-L-alanine amidase, partial [Caulifigura sp.]|nr:N-acetylmuramoyl-L-alanine amidase [Caulifigura sp.]